MATQMEAVKLRLTREQIEELRKLHPGYGEVQEVLRVLVERYLLQRKRGGASNGTQATGV